MRYSRKQMLSTSTAMVGSTLIAIAFPVSAFAQDSTVAASTTDEAPSAAADDNGPSGDTGEIVVTARKRSENVQRVPISITAYSAEDLSERNISNFNDLANQTPGVAITSIAGGNVQNIYLRGVAPGNTANDLNVEANVGVFIDGIYQASRNTLDMISVLDVGQIEIAKGPQSALFGRSTFAGALSIQTKRPSRRLEGSVTGTIGTDEDYRLRASISGPLADGLYARIAAGWLSYDGYGKNAGDRGDNLGGTKKYAVSAALEWAPTDRFTALLSGFVTHSKTEISPQVLLPFSDFNCGNTNAASGVFLLYCGTLKASRTSDISAGIPDTTAKTRQISLNLNYKFDRAEIVSVTGYGQGRNRAYNDYDGTSDGLLFGVCTVGNATNAQCGRTNFGVAPYTRFYRANVNSTAIERVNYFSQEVRIQSRGASPLQWLVGANYYDSRIPIVAGGIGATGLGLAADERLVILPVTGVVPATGTGPYDFTVNPNLVDDPNETQLFGNAVSPYSKARNKTYSVFGSLGYQFGNLRVNAEGRYNVDRKRLRTFTINGGNQPYFYIPISGTSVPDTDLFNGPGVVRKKKFTSFTPRFTADFQATPDIFLYASAAKGVRSGGFNTAVPSPTGILEEEVAFDEETNWTYEAGFKTRLFDRKLMLNAAVFHTDWTDAQVSAFTVNPDVAGTVPRIVRNAGDLKSNGFELQAEFTPIPMFGVGGSVTYANLKFKSGAYDASQVSQCRTGTTPATYASAPGCPEIIAVETENPLAPIQYVPSLEGKTPPRSVKWQWNLHATANVPVTATWRATGRVDVNYTGPTYSNLINTTSFGKRTLTSVRIGLENNRYSVALWGNNIFNKKYVVNSINQPRAGVPFSGLSVPEIYLGEERRIGLTATGKF